MTNLAISDDLTGRKNAAAKLGTELAALKADDPRERPVPRCVERPASRGGGGAYQKRFRMLA